MISGGKTLSSGDKIKKNFRESKNIFANFTKSFLFPEKIIHSSKKQTKISPRPASSRIPARPRPCPSGEVSAALKCPHGRRRIPPASMSTPMPSHSQQSLSISPQRNSVALRASLPGAGCARAPRLPALRARPFPHKDRQNQRKEKIREKKRGDGERSEEGCEKKRGTVTGTRKKALRHTFPPLESTTQDTYPKKLSQVMNINPRRAAAWPCAGTGNVRSFPVFFIHD